MKLQSSYVIYNCPATLVIGRIANFALHSVDTPKYAKQFQLFHLSQSSKCLLFKREVTTLLHQRFLFKYFIKNICSLKLCLFENQFGFLANFFFNAQQLVSIMEVLTPYYLK